MGLGSILSTVFKIATGLGDVLGGAAKNGQQELMTKTALQNQRENTRLGRDRLALDAPGTRMATANQALVSKYARPAKSVFNGKGSGKTAQGAFTRTGGFGGVLEHQGENSELANLVQSDMLAGQRRGGITGGGEDSYMPEQPQEGIGGKLLGGSALATSILGAIGKMKLGQKPQGAMPMATGYASDEDM